MVVMERNKDAHIIARFHKIVLSWDYLHLLKQSRKKSKDIEDETDLGLKQVKNSYKNINDYLGTFEPLLFEEVKAWIVQRKDDEEEVNDCTFGVVTTCSYADGFHLPVVAYDPENVKYMAENDLLLLSKEKTGEKHLTTYAFALVLNREGRNYLKLRTFLAGEVEQLNTENIKPTLRLSEMQSIFTASDDIKRGVWMLKIASLSTFIREYVALLSIGSLPFKDLVLSATESDANSEDRAWKIPRPLMQFLKDNHNTSQLEAIDAGLSRRTFVLIQGPPGTGKTQTILGLLSAILHATPARVHSKGELQDLKRGPELLIDDKYNHWKRASPWVYDSSPRDILMPVDGDDGFFPTTSNELKPEVVDSNRKYRMHVLVCAPSNSALDEIVLRVLNTGIRDENNKSYNPKIVRIGLKPHHSVEAVSMDYLVTKKLNEMDFATDIKKQGYLDTIRASILDDAAIVFSTLSFSGSTLFSRLNHVFDIVIIDEAAQAVEAATLIPLGYGCKQVFLVGDPVQLPATVISPTAERFGYGMSLFKRFQRAGYPVQMLKTQYRMHPKIRSFPSREFYSDALEDGKDVEEQTKRLWHGYRCFGPFCFFDIYDGVESQLPTSGSWVNVDEVDFVLLMYHKLVTHYPELKSSARLAIISPYRHQVKLFRERFRDTFGVESDKFVDINTVDGFQGREKDVAIFSCVRANDKKTIGFVADFRRMNVGITRARSSVLVVGSASTLKLDKHWSNLVESAEQRNCLFKVSKPYASFFSDENLETMVKNDDPEPDPNNAEMKDGQDEVENHRVVYGNPADDGELAQADDDELAQADDDDDDGNDGSYDED